MVKNLSIFISAFAFSCFSMHQSQSYDPSLKKSKRTQIERACLACKKSHQGCDNNYPCLRCKRYGRICDRPQQKAIKFIKSKEKFNDRKIDLYGNLNISWPDNLITTTLEDSTKTTVCYYEIPNLIYPQVIESPLVSSCPFLPLLFPPDDICRLGNSRIFFIDEEYE